jgi:kumamolisin
MAKSPKTNPAKKAAAPRISEQPRVVLPGSEKAPAAEAVHVKPTNARSKVTVSVIVPRKEPLKINRRGGRAAGPVRVSRAEYGRHHNANPDSLKAVKAFAREFDLTVEPDPTAAARRTVTLSGTAGDMQKAFGVTLEQKKIGDVEYRVREGSIHLPNSLLPHVLAVLGLDNRPQAKAHFRIVSGVRPNAAAAAPSSYTPPQVAQAYQFPPNASAAGQTIGIIELGGGYQTSDLTAYFKSIGVAAPKVTAVSVDGGKNSPSNAQSADGEVMLDIEVAASVAPGANVVVYFTPNTDQGFIDAITTAVHDTTNKPSVISISWGGPESSWTGQSMTALDAACQSAAALGVSITVAAGDNGSTDNTSAYAVDFPGSSPHVLCCGGTKLDATGATIASEVVWNETANNEGATGGGVSNQFPLPPWQSGSNVPASSTSIGGRGVPDVSGNADPSTGYTIRVDGQTFPIGGTSAVAPLWAGLIAVANAQLGAQVGYINPAIYAAKAAAGFNDITVGNNGDGANFPLFPAGPGWDPCTGLGSPIAVKLIPLLAPSGVTPAPAPAPTSPAPTPPKPKPPKKPVKKPKKPVKSAVKKAAAPVKKATKKAAKKAAKK